MTLDHLGLLKGIFPRVAKGPLVSNIPSTTTSRHSSLYYRTSAGSGSSKHDILFFGGSIGSPFILYLSGRARARPEGESVTDTEYSNIRYMYLYIYILKYIILIWYRVVTLYLLAVMDIAVCRMKTPSVLHPHTRFPSSPIIPLVLDSEVRCDLVRPLLHLLQDGSSL